MGSPRDYKNTIVPNWCPGCGDFGIQNAIAAVCAAKGWPNEDIALISGIGCSSRIGGYQYCYGAHTTHGRALPFAQGIKCANKDIHMIVCSGDGDSYAIGLGHALHAMKRNMDITYIVFDNQVYGLTKGQTSPMSSKGFVTKTTPDGNPLTPLDAPSMALAAGATFVAQAYAIDMKNMVDVITKAVDHKGFSYVNIFTPCVTFNQFNTVEWYNGHLKNWQIYGKTMILMIRLLRSICFPTPTASYWALFMKRKALYLSVKSFRRRMCALQITWKSRQLSFLKISAWNFGKIVLRRRFSRFRNIRKHL